MMGFMRLWLAGLWIMKVSEVYAMFSMEKLNSHHSGCWKKVKREGEGDRCFFSDRHNYAESV